MFKFLVFMIMPDNNMKPWEGSKHHNAIKPFLGNMLSQFNGVGHPPNSGNWNTNISQHIPMSSKLLPPQIPPKVINRTWNFTQNYPNVYSLSNRGRFGTNQHSRFLDGYIENGGQHFSSTLMKLEEFKNRLNFIIEVCMSTFNSVNSALHTVVNTSAHLEYVKSLVMESGLLICAWRLLRKVCQKLLHHVGLIEDMDDIWEMTHQNTDFHGLSYRKRNGGYFKILQFILSVYIAPWILFKLFNATWNSVTYKSLEMWEKDLHLLDVCLAAYTFNANCVEELSICPGDVLYVAPPELQKVKNWLLVSSGQKRGLVPVNYVKRGNAQPLPRPNGFSTYGAQTKQQQSNKALPLPKPNGFSTHGAQTKQQQSNKDMAAVMELLKQFNEENSTRHSESAYCSSTGNGDSGGDSDSQSDEDL